MTGVKCEVVRNKEPPKRLSKYRGFSARTIDYLLLAEVFYATPESFNDPLDTKPSPHADSSIEELKEILMLLVQQHIQAEMQAVAKIIRYCGPNTLEHIKKRSLQLAGKKLDQAEYYAEPDYGLPPHEAHRDTLRQHIRTELMAQYGNGAFSLAQRFTCPLMWSHYGDEHRGLCIGYSIPGRAKVALHQVNYGETRLISTSRIAALLGGDEKPAKRSMRPFF